MDKTAKQAIADLVVDLRKVLIKLGGTMGKMSISTTDELLIYGNVRAKHVHRPYPNDTDGEDNENCFQIYLDGQYADNGTEVFDREAVKEIIFTYVLSNILPPEEKPEEEDNSLTHSLPDVGAGMDIYDNPETQE